MNVRAAGLVAVAITAILTASPSAGPAQEAAPRARPEKIDFSPKALAAKASEYLAEYATKLARIIADESYLQEVYASADVRTASRRMKGELFLTYLAADREWMSVHDVHEVDGQPVPDRAELVALVQRGAETSVLRELTRRNGRFNIGSVARNFNEPTLGLLILESSRLSSSEFSRQAVVPSAGATLVTLAFKERGIPHPHERRDRPGGRNGPRALDAPRVQVRLRSGGVGDDVYVRAETRAVAPVTLHGAVSARTERVEGNHRVFRQVQQLPAIRNLRTNQEIERSSITAPSSRASRRGSAAGPG
jgi:hypothetical protein